MNYSKFLQIWIIVASMSANLFLVSCGEDDPINEPPEVISEIESKTYVEGFGTASIPLTDVFIDADNDDLTFTAISSNEQVVTVSVSASTLTVTEVGIGTATISVTAQDVKDGSVTTSFSLTVSEKPNSPPVVANAITNQVFDEGFGTETIDVTNVFTDEDGDMLSFEASSSDESIVTADVSMGMLTLTEVGIGSATLSLTAHDGNEGSTTTTFMVAINSAGNSQPTVIDPIPDQTFDSGFGTSELQLPPHFQDAETSMLQFEAVSSDIQVATVAVEGPKLIITEVSAGTTVVTVTALDEDGGSVDDEFTVAINGSTGTCANDNSIATEGVDCTETASVANSYQESISANTRTITTNGIPNHMYNNQRPPGNDGTLNSETNTYEITTTPAVAGNSTSILDNSNRPQRKFGVALNGVPMDPAPAEPFIFANTNTGEYNWDWVMEPNNNKQEVELDCAAAHVQPDGTYHYHGDPAEYAEELMTGLGDGTTTPVDPVQIGWASDGYPVLYKYGPDANGDLILLAPSYKVKDGDRPGDGVTEPCGEYNGKYTNDYEYVSGLGDLDECNGISREITINGETFDYFYVITDNFPIMSRCISGTPSDSFNLGG
jgi:hypothetical protein